MVQTDIVQPSDCYLISNFKNTNEKKFISKIWTTKHGLEDNDDITTRYEEFDNPSNTTKCEKVILSLISKETLETIITFTIIIDTGRIKAKGPFIKEWGNEEFGKFKLLMNDTDGANMDAIITDMQGLLNAILKHPDSTTPNEENFNNILEVKTCLSTLKADFVEFAQDTKKNNQNSYRGINKER